MEPEAGAQLGSDAELITRVRVGDTAAFGELYRRHAGAATALARQVARSPAEADDLVSESFARVLDGLKAGGGPDTAFRAYLFTTLRHTAYDRTRKDSRLTFTDDIEAHETAVDGPDPVIAMAENGMVGKAFAGLPERWQAVLWHTQVEGMSPAETGVLLGMSANAVTSLAFRAREGLREAYLQAHLAETAQEQCRWTTDRLGAWARGGLSKREQATVDAHLQSCEHCAALAAELAEINSSLRGILAPLLLGGLATGYLATLGPVGTLTQAGVLVGAGSAAGTAAAGTTGAATGGATGAVTGAAAGGTAGAHAAGGASWFSKPWAAVGTGVAAAAVAVTVAVIVATAGGSSPTNSADAGPQTAAVGTGITGGTGPGGTGPGGTGTGGTGGPGGTAGTDANGTDGPGPGSDDPGANGSEGDGTGTNGTDADGTNGNTPNDGATGNQTGGTDQPGSNDQPGTNDQPGSGEGVPGDTTTPPGQGGPATSEPNVIPPPLVPTTSTGGPGTTQPTSAPTAPPSSPTSAGPTTPAPTSPNAPTTPSTPVAPTTPTTPTTPTPPTTNTTPTTPTAPGPAVLGISADASASGAAGGSASVAATVSNTGGTASDDGSLVVTAPPGVSVSGYSTGQALRARLAVALAPTALAAGCTDGGSSTTCGLPAVPAGQTMAISLTLAISPTAAPGVLTLQIGEITAEVQIGVEPGITGIAVVDAPDSLPVGQPTPITLTPVLDDKQGVTEAGPITLPVKSGSIWVTDYPDTCTESAGLLTCQPVVGEKDDITYGPITVTVMPGADPDDSLSVTVPNGDESGITIIGGDTGIKIEPWDPGTGVVDWTGPFGGETVGAETMRCSVRILERDLCRIGRQTLMTDIDPAKETAYQQTLGAPGNADLLVARLTWIGSAPTNPGSLDTAQLVVRRGDQTTTTIVKGAAVACAEKGSCPIIRSADVTALVAGADAVWLRPLAAAKLTVGGLTPMAGWSLNLVWMDPDGPSVHVALDTGIRSSLSGSPERLALVARGDADLDQLSGAVWAADPWAVKRVMIGSRAITPLDEFLGRDSSSRTTGFDLLDLSGRALVGSADGVDFTNLFVLRQDQLWIGPLLTIRSVPDSKPPAS